jgi:hypothetical protein
MDDLVPADRYFGAAPAVLRTLKTRVAKASNWRYGPLEPTFSMTGQIGGEHLSPPARGERVFSTRDDGTRVSARRYQSRAPNRRALGRASRPPRSAAAPPQVSLTLNA